MDVLHLEMQDAEGNEYITLFTFSTNYADQVKKLFTQRLKPVALKKGGGEVDGHIENREDVLLPESDHLDQTSGGQLGDTYDQYDSPESTRAD